MESFLFNGWSPQNHHFQAKIIIYTKRGVMKGENDDPTKLRSRRSRAHERSLKRSQVLRVRRRKFLRLEVGLICAPKFSFWSMMIRRNSFSRVGGRLRQIRSRLAPTSDRPRSLQNHSTIDQSQSQIAPVAAQGQVRQRIAGICCCCRKQSLKKRFLETLKKRFLEIKLLR